MVDPFGIRDQDLQEELLHAQELVTRAAAQRAALRRRARALRRQRDALALALGLALVVICLSSLAG